MNPAPLDLDVVDALCAAATAGPWSAHCRHVNGPEADSPALADWPRDEFLQCEVDGPEEPCGRGAFYGPDARFIAAARTLVPQLVAALREAERDAVRVRESVTQTRIHSESVRGNCMAACLASVFGGDITEYDHIVDMQDWWAGFEQACLSRGFLPLRLAADMGAPSGVHFVSGVSPRGVRHMCIGKGHTIIHDPHPSRAGLVEVDTYTVLIPWAIDAERA